MAPSKPSKTARAPKAAKAPMTELPTPEPAPAAPPSSPEEPAILARLEAPSKWGLALVTGGLVLAAGLGVFAVRGVMRKKAEG